MRVDEEEEAAAAVAAVAAVAAAADATESFTSREPQLPLLMQSKTIVLPPSLFAYSMNSIPAKTGWKNDESKRMQQYRAAGRGASFRLKLPVSHRSQRTHFLVSIGNIGFSLILVYCDTCDEM